MTDEAKDINHFLDNPDELSMDNPDAIEALAETGVLPDKSKDDDAGTGDDESGQAAAAQAGDKDAGQTSDNGQDEGTKDAGDDEQPAPIQAKDGKSTIPYEVLDGTRKENQTLKSQLEEKAAENERLQRELEASAQHASDDDGSGSEGGSEGQGSIDDRVLAKFHEMHGMTPDEFEEEYGDNLKDSFLRQTKESIELNDKIEFIANEREREHAMSVQDTVQTAIDSIPALAKIQANDPVLWNAAVAIDQSLRETPEFADKSYQERFTEVAKRLNLEVGDSQPQQTTGRKSGGDDDSGDNPGVPASLSDFPGGSPPAQSETEEVGRMSVTDLAAKFDNMSPEQQEAYLNNL